MHRSRQHRRGRTLPGVTCRFDDVVSVVVETDLTAADIDLPPGVQVDPSPDDTVLVALTIVRASDVRAAGVRLPTRPRLLGEQLMFTRLHLLDAAQARPGFVIRRLTLPGAFDRQLGRLLPYPVEHGDVCIHVGESGVTAELPGIRFVGRPSGRRADHPMARARHLHAARAGTRAIVVSGRLRSWDPEQLEVSHADIDTARLGLGPEATIVTAFHVADVEYDWRPTRRRLASLDPAERSHQ